MHALKGRKYYACTEERSQKRREIMVTITRRDLCRLALLSLMVAFDGRSYKVVATRWRGDQYSRSICDAVNFIGFRSTMERPLDDAAMLHFIRDSLFRSDSPLHHEFSVSLEKFIAERIASRESEWFAGLSRDLHSCSEKLADTQAKVIELEHRIDGLQTTEASATAATDHRVDILQSLTENATHAAANKF